MKYIKKLAVVVVLIVSCMMERPLAIKAGMEIRPVIVCNHEPILETLVSEYWYESEQDVHTFNMSYFDGEEWRYDASIECTKTYIHQVYQTRCCCGLYGGRVTRTDVHHSNRDCPSYK